MSPKRDCGTKRVNLDAEWDTIYAPVYQEGHTSSLKSIHPPEKKHEHVILGRSIRPSGLNVTSYLVSVSTAQTQHCGVCGEVLDGFPSQNAGGRSSFGPSGRLRLDIIVFIGGKILTAVRHNMLVESLVSACQAASEFVLYTTVVPRVGKSLTAVREGARVPSTDIYAQMH